MTKGVAARRTGAQMFTANAMSTAMMDTVIKSAVGAVKKTRIADRADARRVGFGITTANATTTGALSTLVGSRTLEHELY